MAKKPMGNPWSHPSPPCHPADATRQDDAPDEENLSEHALREKIELIESRIASGLTARLPDKGLKLCARLQLLRKKLWSKGKRVPTADEGRNDGGERCAKPNGSPVEAPAESTDYISKSSIYYQVQPLSTTCFHGKFEAEADDGMHNADDGTCSKGLSSRGETIIGSKLNEAHVKEADMSSRTSPKSCSTPTIETARRNSSSNSSYSEVDGRMLTRSSKRRKALENHLPQHRDWREVHAVVLLDEEDELPIQSTKEKKKFNKWKDARIHYPSRDHPECVEICYSDIKCLDPESYLSSTIMNFYIQYLQKTISPSARLSTECHFFNTYFYKKLEEALCCKVDRKATFSKLRRWLKGVNIFQKAYIFLPIHGNMHWSLVIICIPALEDESGPIILHLDSLGFHDGNRIFKSIESYLREEWEHVCQNISNPDVPISEKVWGDLPRKMQRRKITVPQQKNDYDCGLFVLYFIHRFIEEAPERLKKKDLAMFGSKWFQPEEASGLRRQIRKLLVEEFERAGLESDVTEIRLSSVPPVESSSQQHIASLRTPAF